MATAVKEIYEVGETPPLGYVPSYMYANLIPENARAEPVPGFQVKKVAVPQYLKPDEVLAYVMAAGINYNNVWASLGVPLDMVKVQRRNGDESDFHIDGSDASGIVWAVGSEVANVEVGDHVVVHCGMWDQNDPIIKAGGDPILSTTNRIWGYESNWGSFAQFAKVQDHQCLPKPKHLAWEEAAAYMLVGATAYRMLAGWPPHTVQPGDVVLHQEARIESERLGLDIEVEIVAKPLPGFRTERVVVGLRRTNQTELHGGSLRHRGTR